MPAEAIDEKAVFNIARRIDSRETRKDYLQQVCGASPEVLARVLALLEVHEQEQSFLEHPVIARTVDMPVEPPIAAAPGTVIGPYKLLQQIGEGGMGVVYMAEQAAPVRRKVALKIIKPGMDTREVIARFEAERQALALMDHPNIARVFDGGATEAGRPYFVMELVRGVPITDYCDQNSLPVHERLELFVTVCHAVQHAHQKGIIHRDIKPSNVLVTLHDGRPVPKVIDFGVAKAIGQQLTDKTLFTQFAQMVGTPLYMSPEQAEMTGLDIDTRGDIYSLGVLLYELLTGTTPLEKGRMKRAAMDEVRRMIREEDPPSPSMRLSSTAGEAQTAVAAHRKIDPRGLSRLVRGDLDWIVMKALEKDRTRRYETANGFAADIARYLSDEPVEACPPSATYRFRKFARRNKGGLAVGALVLFFLVLLGSGFGWAWRDRSARQAEAARLEKERETETAQQQEERQTRVAVQVESIFGEADRLEKEQKWHEALEAARRAEAAVAVGEASPVIADRVHQRLRDLEFIDRLEQIRLESATHFDREIEIVGADKDSAFAGTDQDYARLFREYGVDVDELPVEVSIDRLKGRQELSAALAAALDDWVFVRRKVSKDEWASLRRNISEADAVRWQRLVAIARGIDSDPLRDQIRATWDQPVTKVRDELRRLADSIDDRALHPATLIILARGLIAVQQIDAAVRILQETQQLHPGDFWLNFELGAKLFQKNDYESSIRFHTAAVAIRPRSSRAHSSLGHALLAKGRVDQAIAEYKKVIELIPTWYFGYRYLDLALQKKNDKDEAIAEWKKIVERDPKNFLGHNGLGLALQRKGDLERACAEFRKATELDPKDTMARGNLVLALLEKGRVDEAIAESKTVIELAPNLLIGYQNLDRALQKKGDLGEAIAAWKKVVERDPKNARGLTSLGVALERQGNLEGAYAEYRKAIVHDPKSYLGRDQLYRSLLLKGREDVAIAEWKKVIELDPRDYRGYHRLGLALQRQGRVDEAIAELRKTIELKPTLMDVRNEIGLALRSKGRVDEAITEYREAIERYPIFAETHVNLADALRAKGQLDEAVAALNKAIELNPEIAKSLPGMSGLAVDCAAQGRPADALRLIDKLLAKPDRPEGNLVTDSLTVTSCVQHFRKRGDVASCRAAAAALEKTNPADANSLYNTACCRALTAAAEVQAGGTEAARPAKEDADRAMALLTKAVAAGFSDVIQMRQDADLDVLREREDFPKLLAFVEVKVPPVDLARSYIRLSQWDKAAAEYAKADLLARPLDDDASAYACLFLIQGDSAGYDRFCQDMIQRATQSGDPNAAYVLARTVALASDSKVEPLRAVQWADQTVANAHKPWDYHTLGLAQFRAGQFDEALQSFTKANDKTWRYRDLNWLGLALVHHHLGHPDEAWECLDKGLQWLEREGPPSPGKPANIQPMDWLEAQVLRREAEELLSSARGNPQAGRYYIRLSQWDQAAAAYEKVDLWARPLREDVVFARASLYLIQGDREGYDRFCRDMLQRVPQTEDHFEAFVLVRTCTMGRRSPVDPAQVVQWAKQAVAGDQPPWYFHVLGLAQFRAGQFDEALQSFTKANVEAWGYRNLNLFGMAMVHHNLGHADEARECLAKGLQWLEREGPPGPERQAKIHPMDWLEAQILRREAEELINPKSNEKPDIQ